MTYSPGDRATLDRQRRVLPWLAAGGLLLLVVCLSPALYLSAAPPPPVNLGAEGLSLAVRLQLYTAASGAWTPQDPAGVTVTDLGDGDYLLEDLPTASGTSRYRVTVALDSDPDRALAELTYGALPGSQVLWIPRIDAPQAHRFFEGDSSGTIGFKIRSGLPAAVDDPGTTVTLDLIRGIGGTALLDDVPAQIAETYQDATSGTWGATLVYVLQPGDLPAGSASPGGVPHKAYFTLHFAGGTPTQRTLPSQGLDVRVSPPPGGGP